MAAFRSLFVLRTAVLRGLGLANDGPVSVTVADADGKRTADLEPIPFDTYTDWAGDYGMLRCPNGRRPATSRTTTPY